jgi:hypothetical protein
METSNSWLEQHIDVMQLHRIVPRGSLNVEEYMPG